jgi:hypothetical protein
MEYKNVAPEPNQSEQDLIASLSSYNPAAARYYKETNDLQGALDNFVGSDRFDVGSGSAGYSIGQALRKGDASEVDYMNLAMLGASTLGSLRGKGKAYGPKMPEYFEDISRNQKLQNAKKVYKANQANRNKRSIANYYQQVPEPDIPRYVRNIAQQEDEVFALDFNKRQKDRLIKKVESKLNVAEGADRFRKPKNLKKP